MNSSSETVLTANHSAAGDRNESIETQVALGLRKPPRSVAEFEPLLTAEEVAKRLNVSTDWGVGSLLPSQAAFAGHTDGRRYVALPTQRD